MRILFTRKAFEAEKTSLQASPQSFSSVASFHWPLPYVCPQGVLIPQGGQAEWVKSCRAASGVLRQQRRTSGWPGPRRAVLSRSVAQSLSRVWLSATPQAVARQAPQSTGFSRQEYWSGCHFLLQEIFPAQGWNLRLLHCQRILFHWATKEALWAPGGCHL